MKWIMMMAGVGALAAAFTGSAFAQPLEPDACRRACQEEFAVCSENCGRGEDPVECDGDCHDERESCEADCR